MDTIDYTAPAGDFLYINANDIDAGSTTAMAEFADHDSNPFGAYSDEAVRLTIRHALNMLACEAEYRADAVAMLSALPDERPVSVVEKRARRSVDFWMMGQRVPMSC